MEKQEFVAIVAITVAMVAICKKVQNMTPSHSDVPQANEQLKVEALAPHAVSARPQLAHQTSQPAESQEPSKSAQAVAALDLGVDIDKQLPELDISIHAPEAMTRGFKLFDLSMMLTSQVIIEPYVEKFTISAPVFYIDSKSAENSQTTFDAKGRKVIFL